jgi:hypothetical protein
MKQFTFSLIILLFSKFLTGQVHVDALISASIPGEVIMNDTVVLKLQLLSFHSITDSGTFALQRQQIDSLNDGMNSLPSDMDGLMALYNEVARGFITTMTGLGYIFRDSNAIRFQGFIGYRLRFKNPVSGSPSGECLMLMLNEYLYVFYYLNAESYNEDVKNAYFGSVKVDKSSHPGQTIGMPYSYKIGRWIGKLLVFGLVIYLVIYLVRRYRRKRRHI